MMYSLRRYLDTIHQTKNIETNRKVPNLHRKLIKGEGLNLLILEGKTKTATDELRDR
jgi:hypothetical protein